MRLPLFSIFLTLACFSVPFSYSDNVCGPLSYKIKANAPLALCTSGCFSSSKVAKNIVQVRAFLQQRDIWSCGYRVLFHALACERALERPESFHKRLKRELCSQESLDHVYSMIGCERELNNFDIEESAYALGFGDRVLILHQDNNTVKLLGDVTIDCSQHTTLYEKKRFIRQVRHQKMLDDLDYLSQTIIKDKKAAYIVCGAYRHWTLFALLPFQNSVKLYMIDSCNTTLATNHQPMLNLLVPYLEYTNAHLVKKQIHVHKKIAHAAGFLKAPIHLQNPFISILAHILLLATLLIGILLFLYRFYAPLKRFPKTSA
jgi:hypothetical protein